MNCINCGGPLLEVFPGSADNFQFSNALDIQLRMGYGEFQDQGLEQDGAPRACFCRECAELLVKYFPGIGIMLGIDPKPKE